jgi:predicted anti-sigma-YlaC factor YlaD
LTGLELRHPGFRKLLAAGEVTAALALTDISSIDYFYWLGAAWLGAISADPADLALVADIPRAGALLEQVEAWGSGYAGGAVHDVLIAYYGSLPEQLGGGVQRARRHFELAVAASGGARVRPYVAMATVTIRDQDTAQFRALLQQALAVPADVPEYRLQNALDREHAAWLLEHMEDFFLEL